MNTSPPPPADEIRKIPLGPPQGKTERPTKEFAKTQNDGASTREIMRSVLYFLSVMALLFMMFSVRGYGQHGTSSNANRVQHSAVRLFIRIPMAKRRPGYSQVAEVMAERLFTSRGKSRSTVLGPGGQGRLQRTGAAGLRKLKAAVEAAAVISTA